MNETIQFTRILNGLSTLYPKLMNIAATTAVNFFKERFVIGKDINNVPFKKRNDKTWVTRKRDKNGGRGVLIDKAILKRDIHKIHVDENTAIIGTTRITQPYAKAHNEGFKGTVTQHVKPFTRRRWGKEKRGTGIYSVKTKQERQRTYKVQTGTVQVQAFTRRIKQNIPQRQFMGQSAFLDRRVQAEITRAVIDNIKKNSQQNS